MTKQVFARIRTTSKYSSQDTGERFAPYLPGLKLYIDCIFKTPLSISIQGEAVQPIKDALNLYQTKLTIDIIKAALYLAGMSTSLNKQDQ